MESIIFGLSFNEAKENIKTISKSLEPQLILDNLKKLLKFLRTPVLKMCFVNTQGDYLPFYHMLVLDEAYLTSTFFTDECKVVANEILDVLTANRNSFTWEGCFGNRHIAGLPVILKKVYKMENQHFKDYEKPIDIEFKEKWAKKTLKFVKSLRPKYIYPDMKGNEAEYVYEWILRQSKEVDLGDEYLWTPVWEAMNIFRLRYDYVVSLYAIESSSFKFIFFEKIRRKIIPDTENIVQESCTPKIAVKETVNVIDTVKVDPKNLSNSRFETEQLADKGNKIEFVLTMPNSKKQRNKFEKKRKLIKRVSKSFIMESFEKIYDFVSDDAQATLEMRNLTRNEMDMLVCFKYYTPSKVATCLIFDAPCNALLIKIHLVLREKKNFRLIASNGKKMQKKDKIVIFRKISCYAQNFRRSYTPDTEEEEYDSSEEVLDEMFDDVMEQLRIQGQKQASSENAMAADMDIYEYDSENETFSTSSYEMGAINSNEKWIGAGIPLRNPLSIIEKMQSTFEQSTSVSPERSRVSTGRPWMPPERLWVLSREGEIPEWDGKVPKGINTAWKNICEKEVHFDKALRMIEPQTKSNEQKPSRKRKPLEDNSNALENYEAVRTPEPCPKDAEILPKMKTKLLEGLSVPLESDKAMRMMRLMGWNGGALGVRGNGLIEPLNPILDLQKGLGKGKAFVGLGHKMNKTQTVKQNKAQKISKKEKKRIKKLAKEKNKSASHLKGNETSTNIKSATGINQNSERLENENNKVNSRTAAKIAMSDDEDDDNTVDNTDSLKCSENDTTCGVMNKVSETTPITLTDEILRTVEDEKPLDAEEDEKPLDDEENEKPLDAECEPIVISDSDDDEEFVHYKNESDSPNKTVRMEFLVTVLDLILSENSFAFLWFSKTIKKACEPHIFSMIDSFNERTEITVADYRENLILNAISEEMVAHSDMKLLIERDPFDRRVITIIKTTRDDNSLHLLIPQLEKFTYPATHIVLNDDHYGFAAVKKRVTAAHIIANRLLLYFVQSDYTDITCKFNFFMHNASRIYINAVVSLLNRQVTNIKLALGSTEYKIFKRIAAIMEDFFLIVKYDKTHMKFNHIRLVKVPINKRCEICQRTFAVLRTTDNNKNSSKETVSDMETSESFDNTAVVGNEKYENTSERTEVGESIPNDTKDKINVENKQVTEKPTQCMGDIDICAPFDDTTISLNQECKNTFEKTVIFESSPKEMQNEKTGIENNELVENHVSSSMDIDIVEVYELIDDTTNSLNEEDKNTSENIVTIESSAKEIEDKIGIENEESTNKPLQSTAVVEVYELFDNSKVSLNEESESTNKNTVIYESPSKDFRVKDNIDIEDKNLIEIPVQSMDVVEVHEPFKDFTGNNLNEVYKESPKYAHGENVTVEIVNHVLSGQFINKPNLTSLIFESMPKDSEDKTSIDNKKEVTEKSKHNEEIFENVHEDQNQEELNSTEPEINTHNLLHGDKILHENCDQNIKMNEKINDRLNKYIEEDDKAHSEFCETPNLDTGELNVEDVNSTGHILNLIKKDPTKNSEDFQINHNQNVTKNMQNIESVIDVDNCVQNTMVSEVFSAKVKKVLDNVQGNSNKNLNEVIDLTFDDNANHVPFNTNSTWKNK